MTLDELGLKYGTDKGSNHHDYLKFYERRVAHLRNQAFTLIEIGVFRGGSVRTWGEHFPNAKIVGLDVTPDCKQYEGGNVSIRIGNAFDTGFLFDVLNEFGRPLVVLDDGSHRWDHQIAALQYFFPIITPGGFFIMEDIDTSFESHLKQAAFAGLSPISCFDYLAKLARVVSGDAALGSEQPYDLFINDNFRWVGSVEFGRRTAIISKKTAPNGGSI